MPGGTRRNIGGAGIAGQPRPVDADMQLLAYAVGRHLLLGLEQLLPQRSRQQKHIVRGSLRGEALRHANRLEERIRARQVDYARDLDLCARQPRPVDNHRISGTDMQVGCRLLGDENPLGRPSKGPDLAGEGAGVGGV